MSEKSGMSILKLLEEADWDDICSRLMMYALSKLSFLSWSPLSGISPEEKAEEMIQDAIKKTVLGANDKDKKKPTKGIRRWNPDKISLLDYLLSVLKSDIGHLYKSEDYLLTTRLPSSQRDGSVELIETEELINRSQSPETHSISLNPDPQKTPEDSLIENEMQDSLVKAVEGDDELESIVICMLDGFEKPSDISEQTGIDIKDIYNAKKRLYRIYDNILPRRK